MPPLPVEDDPVPAQTPWEATAEAMAAGAEPVTGRGPTPRAAPSDEGFDPTAETIRDILLELVPEAGQPVRWIDVAGRAYEAAPLLSARRQVLLGERASLLIERVRVIVNEAGGRKAPVAALVVKLAKAASTDLLDQLDEAFAVALPDQLTAAAGVERQTNATSVVVRASDYFPVEEMLKAILPFYARPLAELAGLGDGKIAARLSR